MTARTEMTLNQNAFRLRQSGACGNLGSSDMGWNEFVLWLLDLMPEPCANAWLSAWTPLRNANSLLREFEAVEKAHLPAIEFAIAGLKTSGAIDWEGLSKPASVLLMVRIETVVNFAVNFYLDHEDCASVIPFPNLEFHQLAGWFLTEWWSDRGRKIACQDWVFNQWNAGGKS